MKHHKKDPSSIPSRYLAFSEQRRPLIFWNITGRCNLSCSQCYINAADKQQASELSTSGARHIVDEAAACRTPLLMLSGGEPLLRQDFWEILEYARSRGLRVAVSSNGILVTEDVAERLKSNQVGYVGISLDGAFASTHDAARGLKGSFDDAIKGLRNCVELGVKCGVRFTATKDNFREVPELLGLTQRLGIPRFCLYWLVPSGRGRSLYWKRRLGKDEIAWVLARLYESAQNSDPEKIEILTVDAPQDGVYILDRLKEESPSRHDKAEEILEYTGDTCSAGDRILNVDPEGNIYPCQFAQLESLKVGNLREGSLAEILNDPANRVLSSVRSKVNRLKGKCGSCVHRKICTGGCRVRAYFESGDLWAEDPMCISYRAETEV
ncbi:radical SAM protein [Candidatus Bathyarchaeota archaeon]|nr:radical SAM protein [Candidatus Bathyarchaeota archaeon]